MSASLRARPSRALRGRVKAPGDKSISHRALILGGLAHGATEIEGLLLADDVLRTARAVRALGADLGRVGEGGFRVEGRGGFKSSDAVVDCGNSGTAVRLLMGAVAGCKATATFDGDASLRGRPMKRVIAPLEAFGVRVEAAEGGRLPVTVSPAGGDLRGIEHWQETPSAQVKSAVLLAGLNAFAETVVYEPEPTRDHTERMLTAFGARLKVADLDDCRVVRLPGRQKLKGTRVVVPGDPSSAAFPLVAALLTPGSAVTVEGVLLNPLRIGLFETLREMGADLTIENAREQGGEQVGDVTARTSALRGVVVPAERAPSMIDEYPILAVAAAFAEGSTVMNGVGELRVKESDRIALMVEGLTALGAAAEADETTLVVHGAGGSLPGGAEVRTTGDHRVAMAHLVAGLACEMPVVVDEAGMIATSFPGFAHLMQQLGADIADA